MTAERPTPPSEQAVAGDPTPPVTPPALETRGLTKTFGGLRAVDDVSVSLPAGQRRAIIGPNGAGKTTLFNLVAGQLRPTHGTVRLFGEDVTALAPPRRARTGLARTFQITNLMADLSVHENALLAVAAQRPRTRWTFWRPLSRIGAVAEPAERLLRTWELWGARDRRVSELAYGQQRVLEIVLALAAEPRLLLLDEPTAGLSRPDAERTVEVARGLPPALTLVIIEHDMDVAFRLGDVVQVMVDGAVLATGEPDEVQRDPEVIAAYLGAQPGSDDRGPRGE